MPRSKSGTGVRSHRCSCDQSHIRSNGTSYLSPFPQLSHSFLVKYIVLPTPLCGVPCPCYVAAAAKIRTLLSQETRATGKTLSEPACKKTWGEVKCISLLSIRQPLPNQTCLSTARPHYQEHLQQHHNSFHQKRPCQLWPVLPLLLGSVDTEDWIGPGGSNKLLRAPPRNVPISVDNNAKNQTIQLLTSLAAKSLSISNQGSTSSHICGSSPSN